MRLWQYSVLVEPVLVTTAPEDVTVDKWFTRTEEPSRRRRTMARFEPQIIDAAALTQPEAVTVDRVFEQVSDPRRRRRTNAWMAHLAQADVFSPESVTVDRFAPQIPDQVFRKKKLRQTYPAWFGMEEEPAEQKKDDWQPQPQIPRTRRGQRRPHLMPTHMFQENIVPPITTPEIIAAVYQTPQPYRRHKPWQYLMPFVAFREPSVLFHPCPPYTDWTPVTVSTADWAKADPPTTGWTQTAEMDATDTTLFDDTSVTFDSLLVPFDGMDASLLEGNLADPPNTNWAKADPQTTNWGAASTPTTDWGTCGGSEG